jgi:hypothetical protein
MPNLSQIAGLRIKYDVNNSKNLGLLKEYLVCKEASILYQENDAIRKAFSGNAIISESINPRKIRSSLVEYFQQNSNAKVALLFIDICGFSNISQSLNVERLTTYLNGYYETVFPIIYKNGGEVEKIMGDGIICVFGKPFINEEDEIALTSKAEKCAMEIIGKLYLTSAEVKVAMHYGEVKYHKIDSLFYEEYTMFGDVIAQLFRLESASRKNSISFFSSTLYSAFVCLSNKPYNSTSREWAFSSTMIELQSLGNKKIYSLTII